ncbi:MAG: serine/threonine protein kinase [Labilithrix sp.]|nr:serine/threonine protein kinase [Labilithrix sp.]
MDLHPGVVFGRYTIDAELGRGGMGRVLLATDAVLHRKVALKILHPGLDEKEEVVARFFREARLAAQLTHPNTVHVYDLGEVSGNPFIAMEYVAGKALTAYVGDTFVPAERRMRWLVDVAKGLGAAHARGLLHRDMKPANVMVSNDGIVKVVDFGLAKKEAVCPTRHALPKVGQVTTAEMRSTFQTAVGFVVGTPAYMAPEQLEAAETIDARADQFGWALTAYTLMLGKNLRKEDPLLFGPIPLLSDRVPGVSRRAAEIVLRALSNDREMRFASMDALVAELEPALAARPSLLPRVSQAPVEPPAPRSQHPTPRMTSAPPSPRFCPECGLSFAMSSSRCKGPHVAAFPKPPGIEEDSSG